MAGRVGCSKGVPLEGQLAPLPMRSSLTKTEQMSHLFLILLNGLTQQLTKGSVSRLESYLDQQNCLAQT